MTNLNLETDLQSALKEWSVAIRALELGRQIVLIRKGGLRDSEGVFEIESSRFWLLPTKWHEAAKLLKPQHHDLLQGQTPGARGVVALQSWAQVEGAWSLAIDENLEEKLMRLEHIWSTRYLDVRLNYQSEKPLQVLALRVHVLPEPHLVQMQSEYSGCKSWVELKGDLKIAPSRPALEGEEFERRLQAVRRVLEC